MFDIVARIWASRLCTCIQGNNKLNSYHLQEKSKPKMLTAAKWSNAVFCKRIQPYKYTVFWDTSNRRTFTEATKLKMHSHCVLFLSDGSDVPTRKCKVNRFLQLVRMLAKIWESNLGSHHQLSRAWVLNKVKRKNRSLTATTSRMRSHAPFDRIGLDFCVRCRIADVINRTKFYGNRSKRFRAIEPRKAAFPLKVFIALTTV